jgi:hypothetical protein
MFQVGGFANPETFHDVQSRRIIANRRRTSREERFQCDWGRTTASALYRGGKPKGDIQQLLDVTFSIFRPPTGRETWIGRRRFSVGDDVRIICFLRPPRRKMGYLIVATLAFLLSGCIIVPFFPVTHRSGVGVPEAIPSPTSLVGDKASSRLIRPGAARADIRARIGEPDLQGPSGLVETYDFRTSWLYLIILVPGHGSWQPDAIADIKRRIDVHYDEDGRVTEAYVFRLP